MYEKKKERERKRERDGEKERKRERMGENILLYFHGGLDFRDFCVLLEKKLF